MYCYDRNITNKYYVTKENGCFLKVEHDMMSKQIHLAKILNGH